MQAIGASPVRPSRLSRRGDHPAGHNHALPAQDRNTSASKRTAASRFQPDRFVEIRARVNESADDGADAELIVEVRDNGIGVPSEARDKLFDRFFRALKGDAAVEVEGTGLGLSIVRETVEMLGGRAWAES